MKIILSLMLFGLSVGANASPFETLFGAGAKAKGMGGIGVVLADDFHATYNNPAGLSWCSNHILGVSLESVTSLLDVNDGTKSLVNEQVGSRNVLKLGACIKLPYDFSFGFYASQSLLEGIRSNSLTLDSQPRFLMFGNRLKTPTAALGLSYQILKNLSLGISATIVTINEVQQTAYIPGKDDKTGFSVNMDAGISPSVGLTLGTSYKPLNWLDLGFVYHSPTYTQTTILSNTTIGIRDDWNNLQLSQTFEGKIGLSPHQVGLGAAFIPTHFLKIATELSWQNWSSMDQYFLIAKPVNEQAEAAGPYQPFEPLQLKDIFVPRVGVELTPFTSFPMAFRSGYSYKANPFYGPFNGKSNVIDGATHRVSTGLGYEFKRNDRLLFAVDAFGSADIMGQHNISKGAPPRQGTLDFGIRNYSYSGVVRNVGLGVKVGF